MRYGMMRVFSVRSSVCPSSGSAHRWQTNLTMGLQSFNIKHTLSGPARRRARTPRTSLERTQGHAHTRTCARTRTTSADARKPFAPLALLLLGLALLLLRLLGHRSSLALLLRLLIVLLEPPALSQPLGACRGALDGTQPVLGRVALVALLAPRPVPVAAGRARPVADALVDPRRQAALPAAAPPAGAGTASSKASSDITEPHDTMRFSRSKFSCCIPH